MTKLITFHNLKLDIRFELDVGLLLNSALTFKDTISNICGKTQKVTYFGWK